jgi:serine/threonine protein kinase
MIGTKLAHYEITSHIGSGGMGDVYQATDTKLGRSVAIKFLPEAFSHDPERVARFQREARVLASLNHPNIAAIFGLEEIETRHFLVMELVPGETLADRITRGLLRVEEALPIAKQIAEALEEAHEKGIIHRDLKPANIKVTPDGKVKVLDFGLAKAYEREQANMTASNSPTIMSMAATNAGMILGTAAYMSPEQARGKSVDARTDIWAFGCVIYEMFTGRPVFEGETATDILAKIIEREPDWSYLPAEVPSSIRTLLEVALSKDPKQRLQHVGDVRVFLNRSSLRQTAQPAIVTAQTRRRWLTRVAVSAAFLVTLVPAGLYFLRAPEHTPEFPFEMSLPGIAESLRVSPDGQRVAYVANLNGKRSVWIRTFGSASARQLPGTENASDLVSWAPDSLRLAFRAEARLKRIDVNGGSVTDLAEATANGGGAWNSKGDILFLSVKEGSSLIMRVHESGGAVTPVTAPDASIHVNPVFLPDERRFLYVSVRGSGTQGELELYAGSLDKKQATRLRSFGTVNATTSSPRRIEFVKPGWLLLNLNGTLSAEAVDAAGASLSKSPIRLAERVSTFSASEKLLVYREGPSGASAQRVATNQLAWFDRIGGRLRVAGDPDNYLSVALSPDDRRAAIVTNGSTVGGTDLLVMDVDRGSRDPLAAARSGTNFFPVWSPTGTEIAFAATGATRTDAPRIYRRSSISVGENTLLVDRSPLHSQPQDWSSDDKFLIFISNTGARTKRDLWYLPLAGGGKPVQYSRSSGSTSQAQLSPDGRWLAYSTDESGSFQIVVQSFPDPKGDKKVITSNGGTEPRWRRSDGGELYYLATDGKLMAVPVKSGAKFEFGAVSTLFQTPLEVASPSYVDFRYDVSRDGKHFLIISPVGETAASSASTADSTPITAVFNWTSALTK